MKLNGKEISDPRNHPPYLGFREIVFTVEGTLSGLSWRGVAVRGVAVRGAHMSSR